MRKGEHSTQVVYYGTALKDAEPGKGEDGQKRFRFIHSFNVFNAEQIDGLPQRFYSERATLVPVAERIPELDAFVGKTGADVRHGGGRAFYRLSDDFIQMPEFGAFPDAEGYYATLAHEMTHNAALLFMPRRSSGALLDRHCEAA
ncbi:MAG: putative ArdC antirestriction protein [Nevskia sp.]|nr:putative ArdC antirestriction protein [Nevskia sp.]